jgi:hypothetical protein
MGESSLSEVGQKLKGALREAQLRGSLDHDDTRPGSALMLAKQAIPLRRALDGPITP